MRSNIVLRIGLWLYSVLFSSLLYSFPLEEREPCYEDCGDPSNFIGSIFFATIAGFIAHQLRKNSKSSHDIGVIFLEACAVVAALIIGDGKIVAIGAIFLMAQVYIIVIYAILDGVDRL